MADIKQAAKWMDDGKKTRRASWPERDRAFFRVNGRYKLIMRQQGRGAYEWEMIGQDLLADDWEIAE